MLGMNRRFSLCLLSLLGCGDSGSGVASGKKLSDLTTSDAMSICNAHKDQLSVAAICTASAVQVSSSKSECAATRDSCTKELSGQEQTRCKGADMKDIVSCSGTVGEFES